MPRHESTNEYERKLLENIKQHGWQCTSVGADDGDPCFSYTIGLYHTYCYPELLLVGLPTKIAHGVLSAVAEAAATGNPFNIAEPTDAILEGYSCVFVKVLEQFYGEYVLSATWYYEGNDFPLYQLVWPSVEGYFPWHERADAKFRSSQPVAGVYNETA